MADYTTVSLTFQVTNREQLTQAAIAAYRDANGIEPDAYTLERYRRSLGAAVDEIIAANAPTWATVGLDFVSASHRNWTEADDEPHFSKENTL